MKIQIKNRFTGAVIFETDAETIGAAVKAALAVKANLRDANLRDADLRGANLRDADLRGANLCDADLRNADLRNADLRGANLCDANLCGADLRSANLCGADLRSANLCGADLKRLLATRTILPDGDLVGWKKLQGGTLCKLSIPAKAKRVGGLVGRKCRAEFAIVLEGEGSSDRDSGFIYRVGEMVKPDKFDPNPLVECSHGIHFFITKQEAETFS